MDKRSRITTWCVMGAIVIVAVLLTVFTLGSYIPMWFLSVMGAIVGLCVLSIPRSIRLTDTAVEIRCVVEVTQIPYGHVKNVRRIERSELRPLVPLFASIGVFGYFGYYLDVRNWDTIKLYTTARKGLVLIEDTYEQRYLVNVDRPDRLVTDIKTMKALAVNR